MCGSIRGGCMIGLEVLSEQGIRNHVQHTLVAILSQRSITPTVSSNTSAHNSFDQTHHSTLLYNVHYFF